MDRPDSSPSRFAYLMVVRRGDIDRVRFLSSTFRDRPVEVMSDRRTGDRRRTADNSVADRRAGDRRQRPPTTWDDLGFLIARRELDKEGK
jgi:hypothetical protein